MYVENVLMQAAGDRLWSVAWRSAGSMAVPPIVMSHLIYAAFRGMDDTVAGLLAQHPAALNAVCEVG